MMVLTGEVTSISANSANASGEVIDIGEGATQHGHCYSEDPNVTVSGPKTQLGAPTGAKGFTSNLTNLKAETRYYIKAYIRNEDIVVYGKEVSFTTAEPSLATITTSEVSSVSRNTAVCGGNVTDDGGSEVTARGVIWDTGENPSFDDTEHEGFTEDGTGTGQYTSNLTGLTANTTYYVRAWATNSISTVYGEVKNFTTTELSSPTITTAEVSSVSRNTAVCGGNVTDDGGSEVTARGVIWGTEENPSPSFDNADYEGFTEDGTGTGEFTSNLTDLSPQNWYHVRAYATNSIGTAYGEVQSFVTQEPESGNIMKIHDITAQAEETLTVDLEILNEEEFVGFNLDITLPEGFEYIADSEELFRSDDHMLSIAVLEGNIVRIISGSQENNPYKGNEGIILSFDMESPSTAGTYILEIQDAVIGDSEAVNILTETVDGTVVLE
ncbi:MAG: hypothetical protein R6U58_11245 [Bacteroidales bacterium]